LNVKADTYRQSITTSGKFGDSDVSVDINRATWFQPLCCGLFTVYIEHHLVSVNSKVQLVPVLVKYLPKAQRERDSECAKQYTEQ
jgi:hypothetical protein